MWNLGGMEMLTGKEMLWDHFKQRAKTNIDVDLLAKNAFERFKKDLEKK